MVIKKIVRLTGIPDETSIKRSESHYAAVSEMNGGRKGRWTIVSSGRKDENFNNRLLFLCGCFS